MFHSPPQTFQADSTYRFRLTFRPTVPPGDVQRLVGYVHEFGVGQARARVDGQTWAVLLAAQDDYDMVSVVFADMLAG